MSITHPNYTCTEERIACLGVSALKIVDAIVHIVTLGYYDPELSTRFLFSEYMDKFGN